MIDWSIVAALVAGMLGGGGIVAFFTVGAENKKAEAEADELAARGWVLLIQQLLATQGIMDAKVSKLEERLEKRDQTILELRAEIDGLRALIAELKAP